MRGYLFYKKKRTQPATQAGSLTGRISWNLSLSVPGFVYQFAKATDLNTFGNLLCMMLLYLIAFLQNW